MGSHSLLQGIFPIQGSNPHLLHCRWIFVYHLSHEGSPKKRYAVYTFVGYGDCERCFATWRCGDGMCLCRGAGERWGERERQGALVNTVMGSPGVSPLACGSVGGHWCSALVCRWSTEGRDHFLQPTLVRLFLGVDELKGELTEFKLMVPLAGFSLTLRKDSWGWTGETVTLDIRLPTISA